MEKKFISVEDILANETFLSWFHNESAVAVEAWEQWLTANPDQQHLVDEAVAVVSQLHLKEINLPQERIDRSYQQLINSIDESNKNVGQVFKLNKPHRRWWIAAAAAVLIIFAGVTFWKYSGERKATITASYGQLSQKQLPDGSEVTLNANSTVILGRNWEEGNDREVWLKGEAFFHVKKTSHHNRFIVHTEQVDIIVTGTQFNVVTRHNKSSVLLTEGSVTIQTRDGKEIKMLPGDFVEINNNQLEKKPANEEAILAWRTNQLLFDGTLMTEVAKIISEHYGVKVVLADEEVRNGVLSGIMANNNLDVLLKSLEAAKNYKITRNGDEIIIAMP